MEGVAGAEALRSPGIALGDDGSLSRGFEDSAQATPALAYPRHGSS